MRALEKEIQKHQNLYYIENKNIISDKEFNLLLAKLLKLEQEHPNLASSNSPSQLIGSDLDNKFEKRKHLYPILSLDNSYNFQELLKWAKKMDIAMKEIEKETFFQVQWKIDGATLVLYYKEGNLSYALTRGNSSIGDDVTENAKTIRSIPHKLKEKIDLVVRGEVYMNYQEFSEFNENTSFQYANPRNLSAGSLKHKKSIEVAQRPLRWFAYDIYLETKHTFQNDEDILEEGKKLGIPMLTGIERVSLRELEKCVLEFQEKKRKKLPFPVDGLVIKLDNLSVRKKLGATTHSPRWAIAYKFEPEVATSKIKNIELFVGRTGRITPRACLDTVKLAGTQVSYATLHNADFISKLGVAIGSTVKISKRGEIIPAIEEVIEKGDNPIFSFPKKCPACGTKIVRLIDMADYICPSENCPQKNLNKIIFFCARKQMDIVGLGEKIVSILFEKKILQSIPDIYHLKEKKEVLKEIEGFGERSVNQLLESIENSKKQTFQTILRSLGLEGIGSQVSELLVTEGFNSFEKIKKLTHISKVKEKLKEIDDLEKTTQKEKLFEEYFTELNKIKGIGLITAKSIILQFNNLKILNLFYRLEEAGLNLFEKEKKKNNILAGQSWCITGSFENFKPREKASIEIKEKGGKVVTSITSNTTHLLLGLGGGSKSKKAKDFNIQIVEEKEFLEMLKKNQE